MKSQFLAIAAVAILVGSIRVVLAGNFTPQASEVCYDGLGNTRYVKLSEPCKPDEKRTKLIPQMAPTEVNGAQADDPVAQLQNQVTDLMAKVSALQAQVNQSNKDQSKSDNDPGKLREEAPGQKGAAKNDQSNSSGGAATQRITAPFEVVDSHGKVILRVSEDAETSRGARITIGPSSSNKYGLRVFNQGGLLVSGVGHAADGGGLVVVSDGVNPVAEMSATDHAVLVFKGTKPAAGMKTSDHGGEMTVFNDGTPVAHMSTTSVGGGAIVVARSDGFGLFEAQAEPNGGGSACVNRISNAGNQGRWCLGTALPLR